MKHAPHTMTLGKIGHSTPPSPHTTPTKQKASKQSQKDYPDPLETLVTRHPNSVFSDALKYPEIKHWITQDMSAEAKRSLLDIAECAKLEKASFHTKTKCNLDFKLFESLILFEYILSKKKNEKDLTNILDVLPDGLTQDHLKNHLENKTAQTKINIENTLSEILLELENNTLTSNYFNNNLNPNTFPTLCRIINTNTPPSTPASILQTVHAQPIVAQAPHNRPREISHDIMRAYTDLLYASKTEYNQLFLSKKSDTHTDIQTGDLPSIKGSIKTSNSHHACLRILDSADNLSPDIKDIWRDILYNARETKQKHREFCIKEAIVLSLADKTLNCIDNKKTFKDLNTLAKKVKDCLPINSMSLSTKVLETITGNPEHLSIRNALIKIKEALQFPPKPIPETLPIIKKIGNHHSNNTLILPEDIGEISLNSTKKAPKSGYTASPYTFTDKHKKPIDLNNTECLNLLKTLTQLKQPKSKKTVSLNLLSNGASIIYAPLATCIACPPPTTFRSLPLPHRDLLNLGFIEDTSLGTYSIPGSSKDLTYLDCYRIFTEPSDNQYTTHILQDLLSTAPEAHTALNKTLERYQKLDDSFELNANGDTFTLVSKREPFKSIPNLTISNLISLRNTVLSQDETNPLHLPQLQYQIINKDGDLYLEDPNETGKTAFTKRFPKFSHPECTWDTNNHQRLYNFRYKNSLFFSFTEYKAEQFHNAVTTAEEYLDKIKSLLGDNVKCSIVPENTDRPDGPHTYTFTFTLQYNSKQALTKINNLTESNLKLLMDNLTEMKEILPESCKVEVKHFQGGGFIFTLRDAKCKTIKNAKENSSYNIKTVKRLAKEEADKECSKRLSPVFAKVGIETVFDKKTRDFSFKTMNNDCKYAALPVTNLSIEDLKTLATSIKINETSCDTIQGYTFTFDYTNRLFTSGYTSVSVTRGSRWMLLERGSNWNYLNQYTSALTPYFGPTPTQKLENEDLFDITHYKRIRNSTDRETKTWVDYCEALLPYLKKMASLADKEVTEKKEALLLQALDTIIMNPSKCRKNPAEANLRSVCSGSIVPFSKESFFSKLSKLFLPSKKAETAEHFVARGEQDALKKAEEKAENAEAQTKKAEAQTKKAEAKAENAEEKAKKVELQAKNAEAKAEYEKNQTTNQHNALRQKDAEKNCLQNQLIQTQQELIDDLLHKKDNSCRTQLNIFSPTR
jgi:hypothetical protein